LVGFSLCQAQVFPFQGFGHQGIKTAVSVLRAKNQAMSVTH
jgi:hypothetical protein